MHRGGDERLVLRRDLVLVVRVGTRREPAVAAATPLARLVFAEVRIAAAPTEDALLAALGKPGPAV